MKKLLTSRRLVVLVVVVMVTVGVITLVRVRVLPKKSQPCQCALLRMYRHGSQK
ncbi:Uncharacterised protein [Weissella viridescens]|uniref:Uncharacterized protein n=1 Tax=Weissella viridescens TaxID=1629 RepID=A0A380P8V5_WEIVI|nr:Uncharacterised protein [Weissella viridescens]